jgi:hypothetical protein
MYAVIQFTPFNLCRCVKTKIMQIKGQRWSQRDDDNDDDDNNDDDNNNNNNNTPDDNIKLIKGIH